MPYRLATIEDDLIIATDLQAKLEKLGHVVTGNARNYAEAIALVENTRPELLICDIMLEGEQDGIDAVAAIYEFYKCPVIYLTSNSESVMVKRAMNTHPAAFLLKPFKLSEFAINIDLAVQNFHANIEGHLNKKISDSIFLPDLHVFIRVYKRDIIYVQADGAYVEVVTAGKV